MASTANDLEVALPIADCPVPSQTAEWPCFQPMPAQQYPTLDHSRESPAHSGGGPHHRAAPPPIGQTWGAAAHDHRHIKHLAPGTAHQLSLRLHQLVMQRSQHATPAARLVVLHQLGNAGFLQHALARCFHKKPRASPCTCGTSSSTSGIAWGRICMTALLARAGAPTSPGG